MASVESSSGRTFLRENLGTVLFFVVGALFLLDLVRRLATGIVSGGRFGTLLWDGIIFGMAIGLAGIGLALTYSILSFANFAHGDMVTVGAFAGWMVTFIIAGAGKFSWQALVLIGGPISVSTHDLGISVVNTPLALLVGLLVATAFTAVLAVIIDRIVFRPMRDQSGIALLIASVGVALALRHLLQFFFQTGNRGLTAGQLTPSMTVPIGASAVTVNAHEITLVVLAGLLMVATHVLLQYTKLGTAMRAMADNEDLAQVTGISTERVVLLTWLLGGGLTGAAGFLFALDQGTLTTTFGWQLLLLIFAAVILGGIGSVYGAIAGGLIIGVASRLSLLWLPGELFVAAAFVVMIAVLIIRPKGLLGGVTSV